MSNVEIIHNGLWVEEEETIFDLPFIGYSQVTDETLRSLNMAEFERSIESIFNAPEPIEREFTFHTGPEGARQFHLAMQDEVERMSNLPRYIAGIDPISENDSVGSIVLTGTGGDISGREYFERNWMDASREMGIPIINSDSVTTTTTMTEQQMLEYLDNLSNN